MAHLLTRPRWIAGHLLVVVTLAVFVAAGFWQLRRHAEVSDLRDDVAAAHALPPVAVEDAGMYRRAIAVGVYDPSAEIRVLRSQTGESGYLVLTPLLMGDGTAILVARAWVRLDEDVPAVPEGELRAEGILWPAEDGSWFPEALEAGQVVRRIDPAVVEPFTDYGFRDGYLIEASGQQPEIGMGPHLVYALQWFLFAVIVMVGYPLLLRRAARRG